MNTNYYLAAILSYIIGCCCGYTAAFHDVRNSCDTHKILDAGLSMYTCEKLP